MPEGIGISSVNEAPPRVSELRRFFRVFLGRGLVVFGLVVIIVIRGSRHIRTSNRAL